MLKQELQEMASRLGFGACRISNARKAPHADAFQEWIEDGRAGDMAWLGRDPIRRSDPRIVLPGARSVVVLAMNYWQGKMPQTGNRIARYAWGDDYHDVIEKKLRELDAFLTRNGGTQKTYVDTGPVLERDFAAAAGIGWHGKSTMLISRELGTWFFLAVILTTLDLDADEPMRDHCGRCNRCIDACPTGAITAPYQLDARRCVSYLTIENKGSIPEEFRPLIGDRIYGCDDCLLACPWNRFAEESKEASFAARDFVYDWKLRDFLELDEDGFRRLFRKSPIKRIKRRGFLRNVCVALGNVGSTEDIPALKIMEKDQEPLVAEHAQWAITQIQGRSRDTWPEKKSIT